MNMPKLILLAVDPQMRQTAASRRAIELARRTHARLHLWMPVFDPRIDATAEWVSPDVERRAREQLTDERLRQLAAWTAELVALGLRATCEVVWAKAAHEALLAKVLELSPDLVVKDLDRESFLRRWSVIRSATWKMARTCPAPLMLVQAEAPILPTRIAAAVDPSHPHAHPGELDERVVQTALPLAMASNAALELVHVFPYRPQDEGMSAKMDELIEQLRRDDAEAFTRFAERFSVPQDRRVLLGGEAVVELVRYAEESRVGLLVIGSQYRTGFDRFLLGSTAEGVVAQAGCDLLLVRPDQFAGELGRHLDVDTLKARYGTAADA